MPTATPSKTILCVRCGAPCNLAPAATDRPGVAILRGKSRPEGRGVCPSCNVTAFLQDPSLPMVHIFGGMNAAKRATTLGLPFIHAQLAEIIAGQPGGVGLDLSTVSWERVSENWDLPHPPGTWGMRRPKSEPSRRPLF